MSSEKDPVQKFNTVEYLDYLKNLNQEGPHLGNQYLEDTALQHYIRQFIPENILKIAENGERGLIALGDAVSNEILKAGQDCEDNPPFLKLHDAFGKRLNNVVLSQGWKQQRKFAAEYHIVGSAYANIPELKNYQRFLQNIRNYLYQPSSGFFGCPLAMTDGCANVLRQLLNDKTFDLGPKRRAKIENIYNKIISNDPKKFFVSGQWMTEKRGGTDVNNTTETIAIEYKQNKYKLYGYKFFCSAADCDVTLALARIVDPQRQYTPEEIRKLPVSMFLMKLKKKDGQLNGLEYQSLKEKLGTKQVPTAEMVLNGSKATLVSPKGKGIKYIVNMLQTTRLYNAATSVGLMRRMICLCRDYSNRRSVFGKQLMDLPMHLKVLNDMEITFRGNLIFLLKIADLMGKVSEGIATVDEANIARIGSPLLKLFTAKELQIVSSEGMEVFGGIGYCENSRIPCYFRDGQVLPIWEGTSNVMAHDFHRAISQKNNPLSSLSKYVTQVFLDVQSNGSKIDQSGRVKATVKNLTNSYNELMADISDLLKDKQKYSEYYELFMRDIAMGTSRIFCAALLLEVFTNTGFDQDLEIFQRWVNIKPLYNLDKKMNIQMNKQIAMDKDITGRLRGNGDVDQRGKVRPSL